MDANSPLVLRFDPQTVDHLGAKMYSHLPNAIAELVANAYDANATAVVVKIGNDATISVEDDGHGMSRDEVADKYLHIGRNRRLAESSQLTEGGKRKASGKKGLGKLALFGIGRNVRLSTTRRGATEQTIIELSYDEMMSAQGEYSPRETLGSVAANSHGTTVLLSDLKRSTEVNAHGLAVSLSKLFNFIDAGFSVVVVREGDEPVKVDRSLRMDSADKEFQWQFPEEFTDSDDFLRERVVSGLIVSSYKPLRHGLRGITLYANGRLVNEPEFFGSSESSYAFSYLTGYIEVDFIDSLDHDVIATDRRALDWDDDATSSLRKSLEKLLTRIGQEWRTKRSEARRKKQGETLGTSIEKWVGSIKSTEQQPVRTLVESISSDELDLTADQESQLLSELKRVAPPNAEYVWRHLHKEIRDAAETYYLSDNFYQAVDEAIKRYVKLAKSKAGLEEDEATAIVTRAFGVKSKLRVFGQYSLGGKFGTQTIENIENGQKYMSMGIIAGFRNPLAHEEKRELHDSGAFNYQDCLDALGILSHLMRRLSDAVVGDPLEASED